MVYFTIFPHLDVYLQVINHAVYAHNASYQFSPTLCLQGLSYYEPTCIFNVF